MGEVMWDILSGTICRIFGFGNHPGVRGPLNRRAIHHNLTLSGAKCTLFIGFSALCFGLAGCGGGGGGGNPGSSSPPDQPQPEPQPQPQPQPPQPQPQPPQPQPQPAATCLATADFGCLAPADYQQRRTGYAQAFRSNAGFSNQWGLETIRADLAYADIALRYGNNVTPGAGQTVGLIDSGIDQGHSVFAGKQVSEQFLNGATDETGVLDWSHGTAVASVIAGDPSDLYIGNVQAAQGIAPGADVAMFALPTGSAIGGLYRPISLTSLNSADESWAAVFNTVTGWSRANRRLDFVNMSLSYSGLIEQYSAQDLRRNFRRTISALAQTARAEKTIFILSAGNAHGDRCNVADFADDPHLCTASNQTSGETRVNARSPNILAGLPARLPELRGHVIAVAAVADGNGDYEIAPFSNRCGIAAQWCIAAPGVEVRSAYFGPDPGGDLRIGVRGAFSPSGTSFAAPMVTGSLIVMKHAFRDQLSNTDLVARLLITANNRGLYSNSSVYGRGLLDLGAALLPVGQVSVVLGQHVNGPGVALPETGFRPGSALGNGLAHGLLGQEFAVFDRLGAPFWLVLEDRVGSASDPSSEAWLRAFMTPDFQSEISGTLQPHTTLLNGGENLDGRGWYLGLQQALRPGHGKGHLSLADQALTLELRRSHSFRIAAFSTEASRRQGPASGAILSWQPRNLPFGFRSGLIEERQSLLGSHLSGAFGDASSRSLFVGIDWQEQLQRWELRAEAEIGRADGGVRGGMIEDVSPLVSTAFALHAHRPLGDGTLSLSLSQPLRVEAGEARLSVPVGRTQEGQVLRRSVSADLTPNGRQIDVAAQWNRSFRDGRYLRLGALWSRHPGHDAAASPNLTLLANWQARF